MSLDFADVISFVPKLFLLQSLHLKSECVSSFVTLNTEYPRAAFKLLLNLET